MFHEIFKIALIVVFIIIFIISLLGVLFVAGEFLQPLKMYHRKEYFMISKELIIAYIIVATVGLFLSCLLIIEVYMFYSIIKIVT